MKIKGGPEMAAAFTAGGFSIRTARAIASKYGWSIFQVKRWSVAVLGSKCPHSGVARSYSAKEEMIIVKVGRLVTCYQMSIRGAIEFCK